MRKVLICTPMYDSSCKAQYTISMLSLMKELTSEPELEVQTLFALNESLITKTRNLLTHSFLKSDCTHLLFIDSDIGFDAQQLIRFMKLDEDVVCGIYPKKNIEWSKVSTAVHRGVPANNILRHSLDYLFLPLSDVEISEQGLVEIKSAGTGMMMISRSVFDNLSDTVDSFKLESSLDNVSANGEWIKEYFKSSIDKDTGVYLHEDFTFCKLCKDIDQKIYAATWMTLSHSGSFTY
jgi:hypothetical protein